MYNDQVITARMIERICAHQGAQYLEVMKIESRFERAWRNIPDSLIVNHPQDYRTEDREGIIRMIIWSDLHNGRICTTVRSAQRSDLHNGRICTTVGSTHCLYLHKKRLEVRNRITEHVAIFLKIVYTPGCTKALHGAGHIPSL